MGLGFPRPALSVWTSAAHASRRPERSPAAKLGHVLTDCGMASAEYAAIMKKRIVHVPIDCGMAWCAAADGAIRAPRECAGMRAGTRSVRSGTRAMREARCACPFGNRALQRQLLAEFCLPRHGARRSHSFRVLPYAVRSFCLPRHGARSSGKNTSRQGTRVGSCPRRRLACTPTGRANAAPAELDVRDMRLLARHYRMRGSSGMYVCLQPKCSILFSYRLPR